MTASRLLVLLVLTLGGVAVPAPADEAEPAAPRSAPIEMKDGWFYLDGEKFFINALGYEIGARPGQHPYESRGNEPRRVKQDMAVIKEAGFNAIRTWSELTEDELQMVQDSDLKVVFGINIQPDQDFAAPEVVARSLAHVDDVLAYSRKYDCIIAYLIMNEPMPQHIQKVGAEATVDLWTRIRDRIHQEHPGIPVTISGNSAITEFVDMNLFDIYAYNAYDYDGFNYTHGYANAARILPELNGQGKPLLLTEFGLSVSGEGSGRYGGNTLAAQMHTVPWYYRQLLDAGAAGACPFYYADGWWKGGNPAVHDDTPEEWFGYWGYRDGDDTVGYPRPVWHALKRYNQALVASPRNQSFYRNEIPLEMFLQPDVESVRVVYRDRVVYSQEGVAAGHLADVLSFSGEGLTDRELIFEFYDSRQELLKLESIIVLTGDEEIEWPSISISTDMKNLDEGPEIAVELRLVNGEVFTLEGDARYLFSTHIGWEKGERRRWEIDPARREQSLEDRFVVPEESPLLGLYAGVDISYGKFVKTIHDQQLIYRGDWADPIRLR